MSGTGYSFTQNIYIFGIYSGLPLRLSGSLSLNVFLCFILNLGISKDSFVDFRGLDILIHTAYIIERPGRMTII